MRETKKAEPRCSAIQPVEKHSKESSARKIPKRRSPVKIYLVQWREGPVTCWRTFVGEHDAGVHMRWVRTAYDEGARLVAYGRARS